MATVVLSQPGGLAIALAVACGAAIWLRCGDGIVSVRRAAWSAVAAALGAALGGGLAVAGASFWLGGLAATGGLWLALEWYRQTEADSAPRPRLLVTLRFGAWLVLLTLLAQPACERTVVTWDKPVLAILLDESASMGLVDETDTFRPAKTRAALANAAFADAHEAIQRLEELYDVRLREVGVRPDVASAWSITPSAPLSGLAVALRDAQEMRSARGRPPSAAVLISDGAENVADSAAVRQVAEDLARQHTALLAIGVGPELDQTPAVELEPLALPPQVGPRDTLHVVVAGRAQSCRGQTLPMELLWNHEVAATAALDVEADVQRFERSFDVLPPGPGVYRATVRITLPAAVGGQSFLTSAVVDVSAGRVQVLYLDQTPSTESAFAARALRGDTTIEVTQAFLFDDAKVAGAGQDGADLWTGYDVVVLGRIRPSFSPAAQELLAKFVTDRGLGLLLAGGADFFDSGGFAHSPLADISPVPLPVRSRGRAEQRRFQPTAAGLRHPVFQGGSTANSQTDTRPAVHPLQADESALWAQLPPLDEAVLETPKPAAVVLAVDEASRPLLVAQEVGRGRCLAAGWESTWPWALVSDEGHGLHRRLWRQMVAWLAQRRPQAWVMTNQPAYPLSALADGGAQIRIRGGLAGLDAASAVREENLRAELTLYRVDTAAGLVEVGSVKPRRVENEWTAALPGTGGDVSALSPGAYVLEFTVHVGGAVAAAAPASSTPRAGGEFLVARTRFEVVQENVELRAPTANLALLRAAAGSTAGCGGGYHSVTELPRLLGELAQRDRRERSETRVRWEVTDRDPWGLLVWLAAVLGLEWFLRKRRGLA